MRLLLLLIVFIVIALLAQRLLARSEPEVQGLLKGSLQHSGKNRHYLYYLPETLDPARPLPLLLAFHGGGGNAAGFANTTKLHNIAEREGFIVIYPHGSGAGKRLKKLSWNTGMRPPQGYAEENNTDDVGFIRSLLSHFEAEYPIDSQRIYATGLSKGAMFSYRLACELSGRIRAIAPVAGPLTYDDCRPAAPVALLHIHGDSDNHVPFEGGRGEYTARKLLHGYPAAKRGIELFRRAAGASEKPLPLQLGRETRCFDYPGGKSPVRYCLIKDGGHAWPGSRKKAWQRARNVNVSNDINASEEIWRFFSSLAQQDKIKH